MRITFLIYFTGISLMLAALYNSSCQSRITKVLIIQDEMPQMKVLSKFLQEKGNCKVTIVDQAALPSDFSAYNAVLVYIHKTLEKTTEKAIIDYTKNGGRFVCLHHSISSGKAENEFYFDFLGIRLDDPQNSKYPVQPGAGYAWKEPVTLNLVNLNPGHYITSHNVTWSETIDYTSSDLPAVSKLYPALFLEESEVYLNHKFTDGREKTVLCGIKYFDDRNGQLFMQDRSAWIKNQGKGKIVYLMPGHSARDYENLNIAQMVLNAIMWNN